MATDDYKLPPGITQEEQTAIIQDILKIIQQDEPDGGWKLRELNQSEDLATVGKVVELLNSKGLTIDKAELSSTAPVVSDRPSDRPVGGTPNTPQRLIPPQQQRTTPVGGRTTPSPRSTRMQEGGHVCPKGTMLSADGTCISEGS